MKLTQPAIDFLLSCGYLRKDMHQIEEAANAKYLILKHCSRKDGTECRECEKCPHTCIRISQKRAMELLGEEKFWAGVGRAAFHWSADRDVTDGIGCVFFDASKYFRE